MLYDISNVLEMTINSKHDRIRGEPEMFVCIADTYSFDRLLKSLLNTKLKFPQAFISQPALKYNDLILLDTNNFLFIYKIRNQNV